MSAARQQFTEWKVLHSKREWKENSSQAKAERKQILTNVVHLSGDMILLLDLAQQHRNSMIRKYMSQQLDLEYFHPFTNSFLAVYFQGKLGKQQAEWIEWDPEPLKFTGSLFTACCGDQLRSQTGDTWRFLCWVFVSDKSCDTPMTVQWAGGTKLAQMCLCPIKSPSTQHKIKSPNDDN